MLRLRVGRLGAVPVRSRLREARGSPARGRGRQRMRRVPNATVLVLFAVAVLLVAGCDVDWVQFRSDASHSGATGDTSISSANVGTVVRRWSATTGSPVQSSAAVVQGVVYVGSGDGS